MSRIDDLIAELCPDGVVFKSIGDLCTPLKKETLKTDALTENGLFPVINSGRGWYGRYAEFNNEANAFVVAARGEYAGFINYINERFWAGGLCYPYRSKDESFITTRFIYYVLKYYQQTIMDTLVARGSIPALNKSDLDAYKVPVPPIEVQREIVKILDAFTELEAELEARQKQYRYYRDELLSFDGREDVSWSALGDIGIWFGGGTPSKSRKDYWDGGTIPWVSPKDMGRPIVDSSEDKITEAAIKGSSTKLVPKNSVAIVVRSSILDKVLPSALIPVPVTLNQDMKAVVPDSAFISGYVAHFIRSRGDEILRSARKRGGSVASIETNKLFSFRIPVPSLKEQASIVEILDKLDALVNDISVGLPAEIAARRQQYLYYRDKLLSFKEAA